MTRHPFVSPLTPMVPARLVAQARSGRVPRVALVNAGAPVPLQGLREAVEAGLAEPVLLGDPAKIAAAAGALAAALPARRAAKLNVLDAIHQN